MSRYNNRKKQSFIQSLPGNDVNNSGVSSKLKFNFSFFDGSQSVGQDFTELTKEELVKFFEKLKNFSKEDLNFWRRELSGNGLPVFTEYGEFPKKKSDFTHPSHVPHDVMWSRFRIEAKFRLIGFLIPSELHEKKDEQTGYIYDRNTFYVVFLDKNHLFYKTEKK